MAAETHQSSQQLTKVCHCSSTAVEKENGKRLRKDRTRSLTVQQPAATFKTDVKIDWEQTSPTSECASENCGYLVVVVLGCSPHYDP